MQIATFLSRNIEETKGGIQLLTPSVVLFGRANSLVRKTGKGHCRVGRQNSIITLWGDDLSGFDSDPNSIRIAGGTFDKFSELIADLRTREFNGRKIPNRVKNILIAEGMSDITDFNIGELVRKVITRLEPAYADDMYERTNPKSKQTITDTFTGSDGTLLSSHDSNWASVDGTEWQIQGNRGELTDNYSTSVMRRVDNTFPDDQYAETDSPIEVNDGPSCHVPAVRVDGSGNCYNAADPDIGNVEIREWNGSTNAYIGDGTPSLSYNTDYTWRVEVVGTTITLDIDATEYVSTTDSTLTSGNPGMFCLVNGLVNGVDEFRCTDADASGGVGNQFMGQRGGQFVGQFGAR